MTLSAEIGGGSTSKGPPEWLTDAITPAEPDTKLNSLPTPALIAAADPVVETESSVNLIIDPVSVLKV